MDNRVTYEQPLNERMRVLLRLEHLFHQSHHHLQGDSRSDSRCAIMSLLELVSIFERTEIKADIIKELDRNNANLAKLREVPGVDVSRLGEILQELVVLGEGLVALQGPVGRSLRSSEFLSAILQRSSIPGGTCDFDLPLFHYWLQRPADERLAALKAWFQVFDPIPKAVNTVLGLVRQSTSPVQQTARAGFYQQGLDTQPPGQLVRVILPADSPYYAEISGGKHRFTIRFMEPNYVDRPLQTAADVDFTLACCTL